MEEWEAIWLSGTLRGTKGQYLACRLCFYSLSAKGSDLPATTVDSKHLSSAAWTAIESCNRGHEVRGEFKVVEHKNGREKYWVIEDFRPQSV